MSSSSTTFQTEVDHDHSSSSRRSGRSANSPAAQLRHRTTRVDDVIVEYSPLGSMPMPESVNLEEIMETVLKSMPFSSGKSRLAWRKNLRSESCRHVIHDAFWFFVSHLFGDGQEEVEDRLMFRIADNYVRLFYLVASEDKDQFFGRFYDSLAQIVFHCFHQGYPKSRNKFDDEFKKQLIDVCAQWTTGLVPSRPMWQHWAQDQDSKAGRKRGDLSTTLARAGTGALGSRQDQGPKKWNRAVQTNQTLTYSPLITQFLANDQHKNALGFKIALTEDPTRPIAPTAANSRRRRKYDPKKTVETRAAVVSHTRERRNEILQEYQAARENTLREISSLRKEHLDDQAVMEQKRREVFAGDVHEYSNYLTSIM